MLELSLLLNNWSFQPEAWVIFGILLVVGDLFLGMSYFLLPLGLASFLTAIVVKIGNASSSDAILSNQGGLSTWLMPETWHDVFYWFAAFSLLCTLLLRLFFRKSHQGRDINDY